MPTIPTFSNPVVMSSGTPAIQMETYPVGGCGASAPIFQYVGALYQVLEYVGILPSGADINVFRSLDQGATWAALDSLDGPVRGNDVASAGVLFDGAHTITVAWTTGSPITPVAAPIQLQNFNLANATWGAVYGVGPSVEAVHQIYRRLDGTILAICLDSTSAQTAYVFDGASWSGFSLDSLLPVGWTTVGSSSTVLDPDGSTIHMFGRARSAGPVIHTYYQQILPGDTISGFQDITTLVFASQLSMANPVILSGSILWGVVDVAGTFATILKGTPLGAPAFTVAPSPGIDPTQTIPGNGNMLQPALATDGVNLWAVFLDLGASNKVIVSVTSNISSPFTGWTGAVVYDDGTGPTPLPFAQYPSIGIVNSVPQITVQIDNGSGEPTNFSLSGGSSVTVIPPITKIGAGGHGSCGTCIYSLAERIEMAKRASYFGSVTN